MVHIHATFFGLTGAIVGSADDQVRIAVDVHIPSRAYRIPEPGAGLVALGRPVRRSGRGPRRTTMVDIDATLILLAAILFVGADGKVCIAVAVHVPRRAYRATQVGALFFAIDRPPRRCREPARTSIVEIGPPSGQIVAVIQVGAHDHVRVSVVVDIARGVDRTTIVGFGLVVRSRFL